MEELEAVDWYNQRVDACTDPELKRILEHNRDEEKEHAAMVLEWIRRRDPKMDHELKENLFKTGPITGGSRGLGEIMAILRNDLMTLEAYAKARPAFRAAVIEHKKQRKVQLGNHVTLLFEDEMTLRYQVQEMLRIEKIFDEEGIQSRARCLQSAGAGRQQPEGDDADRICQ